MKVVLGTGNPGREYVATRHNVGFRVVDLLAETLGVEVGKRRFKGLLGEGSLDGERLLLVKPLTYMNLVGECARAALDYFKVEVDSLLVVTDDAALPLGRVRCRAGGSSGGHNGLRSLIEHLGTQDFARLRVGIGRPADGPEDDGLVGHVLGRFAKEERSLVEQAERRAADAVLVWARSGVEECQNRFNRPDGSSGRQGAAGGPTKVEKEKP